MPSGSGVNRGYTELPLCLRCVGLVGDLEGAVAGVGRVGEDEFAGGATEEGAAADEGDFIAVGRAEVEIELGERFAARFEFR